MLRWFEPSRLVCGGGGGGSVAAPLTTHATGATSDANEMRVGVDVIATATTASATLQNNGCATATQLLCPTAFQANNSIDYCSVTEAINWRRRQVAALPASDRCDEDGRQQVADERPRRSFGSFASLGGFAAVSGGGGGGETDDEREAEAEEEDARNASEADRFGADEDEDFDSGEYFCVFTCGKRTVRLDLRSCASRLDWSALF